MNATSLWHAAAAALAADSVESKLAGMDQLAGLLATAVPSAPTFGPSPELLGTPRGTPPRPLLVRPQEVPQRKPSSLLGRATLLHAIAHIEFSAIDLALDHALRFPTLPPAYYVDWLGVAIEETRHFRLLRDHLRSLGHDYGDFPAHDSLWRMAERTAGDVLARMALVPRLMEARGLDATPPIRERLASVGDTRATAILGVILRDEIGHVGLGDKWYRQFCKDRALEPEATYRSLIREFGAPWPSLPMTCDARLKAGFGKQELKALAADGIVNRESPKHRVDQAERPQA